MARSTFLRGFIAQALTVFTGKASFDTPDLFFSTNGAIDSDGVNTFGKIDPENLSTNGSISDFFSTNGSIDRSGINTFGKISSAGQNSIGDF